MSPTVANFLFEAANFLLLAALLGWLLFKPVRRALDVERDKRAKETAETERLRSEVEVVAEQTRSARQAAQEETEAKREEILAAANRQAASIVEDARRNEREGRRVLQEELKSERQAETAALAEAVGRVAADAVRQLLESIVGPSLDAALLAAACAELEALPAAGRQAALVESARPLEEAGRAMLRTVLGPGFQERVVAELGAGVRVTTGAGQVDATAVSIARRAGQAVNGQDSATAAAVGTVLDG